MGSVHSIGDILLLAAKKKWFQKHIEIHNFRYECDLLTVDKVVVASENLFPSFPSISHIFCSFVWIHV